MIKYILIFFFLNLFYSCNTSPPSGIIGQKKMQGILWDIFRAESLSAEVASRDSSKSLAIETALLDKKVFLIHQITEEEFKKSYTYYTNHPDIMRTMLDSINAQQLRKPFEDTPISRKKLFRDSLKNNIRRDK